MSTNRPIDPNHIVTANAAAQNIVIIGDTLAALRTATSLLAGCTSATISLLVEGSDQLAVEDIDASNFAYTQWSDALRYVQNEKVHPLLRGDAPTNLQSLKTYQYSYGLGVAGDFVSGYYIARNGPWYNNTVSENLQADVNAGTETFQLTDYEKNAVAMLQQFFSLTPTRTTLTVAVPSILTRQIVYVTSNGASDEFRRQLYLNEYEAVANRITIYTNINNLKFTCTSVRGVHDVAFQSGGVYTTITIPSSRVMWKTNSYQFLRLATLGNFQPRPDYVKVPSTYRAIIPIPKTNNNAIAGTTVTLVGADNLGDAITTYVAFSLFSADGTGPNSTDIIWDVAAYTTDQDLSVISKEGGPYADTPATNTLLVIEAVNFKNRRDLRYNKYENGGMFDLYYNDICVEQTWQKNFNGIVSTTYRAFTGLLYTGLTTAEPESTSASCNSGVCSDYVPSTSITGREPPILTLIQTTANLYGFNLGAVK